MNKLLKITILSIFLLSSYSLTYGAEYTDRNSCSNSNYQGTFDQACTYKLINDLYSTALNNSYITNSYYTESINKYYSKIYTENTTSYSGLDNLYNEAKKDYIYQKKDYYFKKVESILKDAKNRSNISETTYNSLIDEYTRKIFYVEDISVDALNNIYNYILNSYGNGYNNSNIATSANKDYYYNKIRDILNNARNNGNITSSRYDSLINDYHNKIYNYNNVTNQNLIDYYNEVNNNYSNYNNFSSTYNKDYYYNKIRDLLITAKNNGKISSSNYDSLLKYYNDRIYNSGNISNQSLIDLYNDVYNARYYSNNYNTDSNKNYYYNKIKDLFNDIYNKGYINASTRDFLITNYYNIIYSNSNIDLEKIYNDAKKSYDNYISNNYDYYYRFIKSNYFHRLKRLSNDLLDSLSYKIIALKSRYNSNQNEYQILKALEDVVKEIRVERNINY